MKRAFTVCSLFYTAALAYLMIASGHATLSGLIHDPKHRLALFVGILIIIAMFWLCIGGLNAHTIALSMATIIIFIFDGDSRLHYVGVILYGILTSYSVAARWGLSAILWIVALPLVAIHHIGWAELLYLLWLSILLE